MFTVDDDTVYGCEVMAIAFQTWLQDPQKLVGFAPRYIQFDNSVAAEHHAWYIWEESWLNWKANTLFVTKGSFMHKDHLDEYFKPSYKSLRDEVDHFMTGEDMLFGFLHAHRNTSLVVMVIPQSTRHIWQEKTGNYTTEQFPKNRQYEELYCDRKTLGSRTSQYRQRVLDELYSVFGSLEGNVTNNFVDATTGLPHVHDSGHCSWDKVSCGAVVHV
mmetsp:Transcript_25988/g.47931  ORF Transcript_25988/g.47931 Transcript_25988/m.47931 type:complete len:216 (-) Transcript_25988:96-743(-)